MLLCVTTGPRPENRKKSCHKMKIATLGIALILTLALASQSALAQQPEIDEHPFEVGGQFTFVGLGSLESNITIFGSTIPFTQFDQTYGGIGGRIGYNFNRYFAIEAEGNFLPRRNFSEVERSRKAQFLAGVKAGVREETFGIFAKARPGIMYFSALPGHSSCIFSLPLSVNCVEQSQTNFAFDAGGVFEYYPTPRTAIRIDAGDTIVRFKEAGPTALLLGSSIFTPASTTHSFQMSFGITYRF